MAFQNKRKFCYFKENGIVDIDYKDVKLLLSISAKCIPKFLA